MRILRTVARKQTRPRQAEGGAFLKQRTRHQPGELRLPGIGVLDLPKIQKMGDGVSALYAVGAVIYFRCALTTKKRCPPTNSHKLKEGGIEVPSPVLAEVGTSVLIAAVSKAQLRCPISKAWSKKLSRYLRGGAFGGRSARGRQCGWEGRGRHRKVEAQAPQAWRPLIALDHHEQLMR